MAFLNHVHQVIFITSQLVNKNNYLKQLFQ